MLFVCVFNVVSSVKRHFFLSLTDCYHVRHVANGVQVNVTTGNVIFFNRTDNPNAGTLDQYGDSVSLEGDRLLVGAPFGAFVMERKGHVHVHRVLGGGVELVCTIAAPAVAAVNFGYSVDLSFDGEWALVGASRTSAGPGGAALLKVGTAG